MDASRRSQIEARIEKQRQAPNCTLAVDIRNELEGQLELSRDRSLLDRLQGKRGWSEADNQLLMDWTKETDAICAEE